MPNPELDAKSRIIKSALEILNEEQNPDKITVRKIADRAGVGIGLINYHFQTKDKLLHEAVAVTMAAMADDWRKTGRNSELNPPQRLKLMLKQLTDFGMNYYHILKIAVGYEVLHGDLEVPLYILPLLREIFGRERDELALRIMAFQIIIGMQVILLRGEAFQKYAGIDIFDAKQRDEALDILIDNIIKDKE